MCKKKLSNTNQPTTDDLQPVHWKPVVSFMNPVELIIHLSQARSPNTLENRVGEKTPENNRSNTVKPVLSSHWERSGSVVECLTRDRGAASSEPSPMSLRCVSKNIDPSLVLVQPRKTCPFITERLLMGHKDSNEKNK